MREEINFSVSLLRRNDWTGAALVALAADFFAAGFLAGADFVAFADAADVAFDFVVVFFVVFAASFLATMTHIPPG